MNDHDQNISLYIDVFKKSGFSVKIVLILATCFGSGFLPLAPGTWGSLISLPFAVGAYSFGFIYSSLFLALILTLSIPISGAASIIFHREDPPPVVIDETAGIFVTLFLIPFSWTGIISGFILFRLFDILKPFPIGLIDKKIKGGAGIVLDDVMAGIYANIGLRIVLFVIDNFQI
jgi:phosphatidylglycerophosphatase A